MSRTLNSALIFVLAGCGPLTFGTEVKGESVIPGSSLALPLNVFPSLQGLNDLDFNANREFQIQGVTRDRVTGVAVESVTFKILSPSDQDFTFLNTVQLVARAGDKEVVFAEKVDIADLPLPAPNPTLSVDLKSVDLTAFITAPIITVVLRGKGKQPPKDTRLEVKVKLRVSASP
jgi:hypothetical protein